jgi:hypothetical protein
MENHGGGPKFFQERKVKMRPGKRFFGVLIGIALVSFLVSSPQAQVINIKFADALPPPGLIIRG